jgi:hypothetical protein
VFVGIKLADFHAPSTPAPVTNAPQRIPRLLPWSQISAWISNSLRKSVRGTLSAEWARAPSVRRSVHGATGS